MKNFTPYVTLILTALGCASLAHADIISPGVLVPKKDAQSVSFSPQRSTDIFLVNILSQGSTVKKGEKIAISDFRNLDNVIEDYGRSIKNKQLEVQKLQFELEQQKALSAHRVELAKRNLVRAQEDKQDFVEKRKARMLSEEEERVNKALRHLSYKQEELNQLTQMYKDDQVSEETEEIILKRLKNELSESEFAVQGAKLVSELAKLRNIHRLEEDFDASVNAKQIDFKAIEAQANFDLEQKKLALQEAETGLKRLEERLNELKADREMAEFKAPSDGVLLYGGYVADKWSTIPVSVKLKPGGKLEPYDKIATIVPPNSELIVLATLPDAAPTPKTGDNVSIKVADKQIVGSVIESTSIPDPDGKRRFTVAPKAPAQDIFAPGLPVQVIIAEKQG